VSPFLHRYSPNGSGEMNRIYGWKLVDGGRMEGKSLFP